VADFVPTLAYLQLVVTREGHEKFESFGIHILQPAVNDRALDASGDDRFQVRRVVDALVVSEHQQASTQALGPVAGTELLARTGNADNNDFQELARHAGPRERPQCTRDIALQQRSVLGLSCCLYVSKQFVHGLIIASDRTIAARPATPVCAAERRVTLAPAGPSRFAVARVQIGPSCLPTE